KQVLGYIEPDERDRCPEDDEKPDGFDPGTDPPCDQRGCRSGSGFDHGICDGYPDTAASAAPPGGNPAEDRNDLQRIEAASTGIAARWRPGDGQSGLRIRLPSDLMR